MSTESTFTAPTGDPPHGNCAVHGLHLGWICPSCQPYYHQQKYIYPELTEERIREIIREVLGEFFERKNKE